MVKLLIFVSILWLGQTQAQTIYRDLQLLDSRNPLGSAFGLPLNIGIDGSINLLPGKNLTFRPTAHIAKSNLKSLYTEPVTSQGFSLISPIQNTRWIEVKRKQRELGLGLQAISGVVNLGLTPFKGARETIIKRKSTADEISEDESLPSELESFKGWDVNDQGIFQRYGGIEINLGLGNAFVKVPNVSLMIQTLWTISMKKISSDKVQISIKEEEFSKKKVTTGLMIGYISKGFFKGNSLDANFELSLSDLQHHELYQNLLAGKMNSLQELLPESSQSVQWRGTEKSAYYGVPFVAGKTHQTSQFIYENKEDEIVIDMKTNRNNGLILPLRHHFKIAHHSAGEISLIWFSQINSGHKKTFDNNFFNIGEALGLNGFQNEVEDDSDFGSLLAHIGMKMNLKALQKALVNDFEDISANYRNRCLVLDIDCSKEKYAAKALKKLKQNVFNKKDLGLLLLKEPVLIHAIVKSMKIEQKVEFRFLSENYQSVEGISVIGL